MIHQFDFPHRGAFRAALLSCVAFAGVAGAVQSAYAQDTGLEEIVVTAQKRAENVQDTPLSVTAISGIKLANQGITQVSDLNRVDPALQIGQSTGTVTTFIRGIGNPVTTAGNEASVPIYIDDVYFVRAAFPFFDLSSISRVEVLKGPQGTLFGRNASGGVISIYTKDPGYKPELEARLGYSNYETMDGKFYGNLPITDTLAANLAVSYHWQDQGWGQNKYLVDPQDTSKGYRTDTKDDYWKGHSFSTRGKILWEPTDGLAIKLIGYYETSNSQIGIYSRPFPGTIGGSPDPAHNNFAPLPTFPTPSQVLPALGFYDVALGATQKMYDRSEGYGFSGRVDYEMGFADVVSITAYRKADELYASAGNNSPYAWTRYDLNVIDKQFSQEFQLKSKASSPINWIAGLYYLNADGGFNPTTIRGPGVEAAGINGLDIVGKQKVLSYAGFGQLTYPIDDKTHVTVGARYTIDKIRGEGTTTIRDVLGGSTVVQRFDAQNDFDFTAPPGRTQIIGAENPSVKRKFQKFTYKLSIDRKFGDDVMVYANYARGYKAGTFNTLPLNSAPLSPEEVDAYEVGVKSELFNRLVRLNVAAFWNDISNAQVQGQLNGLVFLRNAGTARTKGAEFDMTIAPAAGLTLRFAGTYLDAVFRDFQNCPTYSYSTVAPGNLDQGFTNCSGHRMPYASRWKGSAGLSYTREVEGAGKFDFDAGINYSSVFNWDADNLIKEPKRILVDSSLGFTPAGLDHVQIRAWVKNLTNRRYNVNYYAQASGSAFSSAPGAPRTFGGELVFKF